MSDADSLLSQVCFDLFDTISVRGDTVECSVSLSVLEVRRDAIMDLLHPEQAVELKLHTDLTGRKLWRVGKTSDAVCCTEENNIQSNYLDLLFTLTHLGRLNTRGNGRFAHFS